MRVLVLYLYSHGVESVENPDAVGHVALQSASADNHVPHGRCVGGTDVHLTGKRRDRQDLVAGNRQRRLHAGKTPIHVILQNKVTPGVNHTLLVGEDFGRKQRFSTGGSQHTFMSRLSWCVNIIIFKCLRKNVDIHFTGHSIDVKNPHLSFVGWRHHPAVPWYKAAAQ